MSRPPNLKEGEIRSFPRVSGDEPHAWNESNSQSGFSPRERG